MTRRLPVIPTAVVLGAAAIMVALGVWQLGRMEEKAEMIAFFEEAQTIAAPVPFPMAENAREAALYRRSAVDCRQVAAMDAVGGRSADGRSGWAQLARCTTGAGEVEILLGWMNDPRPVAWRGGPVTGIIAPAGYGVRLVADPPQAGLQPLAPPDPANMPNNHLAYAIQWFFFAITALVIYVLALRTKGR